MQQEKVLDALNILKERGIIDNSNNYNTFLFTIAGREFTKKKSENSWIAITNRELMYLWARYDVKFKDSWTFIKIRDLTEEQFTDFCEYYNINAKDDKQLEIFNEIEFMDI
jgi:hypothetical protein